MEELLTVGAGIVSCLVVICLIVGFFKGSVNSVFCALIGIAGIVLTAMLSAKNYYFEELMTLYDEHKWLWICSGVFYILMFVRYLPCIARGTDKSSYMAFGDIVEESLYNLTGLAVVIFVPMLFAVPFFVLCDLLIQVAGIYASIYAGFILLLLHSIIGFIRSKVV